MRSRLVYSKYHQYHQSINPTLASLSRPKHMQFFAQMFALEQNRYLDIALSRICYQKPSRVTITVRHTDWYWWEYDAPLEMNRVILQEQRWPNYIETFEIEPETRNGKKLMLDAIVTTIARWVFEVHECDEEEIMDMKSISLLSDLDTDSSALSFFDGHLEFIEEWSYRDIEHWGSQN
jgi:hypothetical protein